MLFYKYGQEIKLRFLLPLLQNTEEEEEAEKIVVAPNHVWFRLWLAFSCYL